MPTFKPFNLAEIYGAADEANNRQLVNQAVQYRMQRQQQADDDEVKLRDFYRSNNGQVTPEMLSSQGYFEQASALAKNNADLEKNKADSGKTMAETLKIKFGIDNDRLGVMGSAAQWLRNPENATVGNVHKVIDQLETGGIIPPELAQNFRQTAPTDNSKVIPMAELWVRTATPVDKQQPKESNINLQNEYQTGTFDPVTGKRIVTGSQVIGQSQDNAATIANQAEQGNLNRQNQLKISQGNNAVTIRGQNMTDARAKEAAERTQSGGPVKPLSPTALKMQNEALDAISTASNIDKDLGAIYDKLETGKLKVGPIENIKSQSKNYIGKSDENSRNFAQFRATLEKLRNDSLRLNNGVQTEGDAIRAWNELLANVNDTELVKQRLSDIRGLNKRAADLKKLNVENMRANYNQPQLDYSKYESQTSPLSDTSKPISAPKIGTVSKGYVFKGGDPANPDSWKKQ